MRYVILHLRDSFPDLVSYSHRVNLLKSIAIPLCVFIQSLTGEKTGIYFIDSMVLKVCHIKREKRHRVFKGLAKSTVGWFNDKGEIMAFKITPGNVDDRKPVPDLVKHLAGKLFRDKGYISQTLFETLLQQSLQLITRLKNNMKNKLMPCIDKILLRKRALIETVNDQLKNNGISWLIFSVPWLRMFYNLKNLPLIFQQARKNLCLLWLLRQY
jgi:hypothetical protein